MKPGAITEYKLNRPRGPYEGRIRLYLTGFREQNIVSVDEVVAAVARLPDAHLVGLKELVYDPNRTFLEQVDYRQWFHVARSKGTFVQNHRKIMVFDFDSSAQFHHILYHEIGHYVFYLVLDSKIKKRWVTELYPNSQHVSDYASRNASEDFAESYAMYLLQPGVLKRIPGKFGFMEREVFDG